MVWEEAKGALFLAQVLSWLDLEEAVVEVERFHQGDLDLEGVTFLGHNELDWEEGKAAPFADQTELDVDSDWVVK